MTISQKLASLTLVAAVMTTSAFGQSGTYHHHYSRNAHYRAKRAQTASDRRHHTGAKIVVGSAVGGAVVGGLLGGPKGAVIGGALGAGGGAVANKARENHDVHKREQTGRY